MAWTAPKTDWVPADGVADAHLNAIGNNLLYIKTDHMDLTAGVHGAASIATPSTIMARDVNGRAKVVAPSAEDEIALKSNVTAEAALRVSADAVLQAEIDAVPTTYLPLAGGTMTGGAVGHIGTDYTTARFRNVIFLTTAPTTEGNNGDICMVYEV